MANYKVIGNNPDRPTSMETYDGPHPDGQPWKKCCCAAKTGAAYGCAFRRTDVETPYKPAGLSRFEAIHGWQPPTDLTKTEPFWCIHQQDNGYIRVCAGWHAKYGKKDS